MIPIKFEHLLRFNLDNTPRREPLSVLVTVTYFTPGIPGRYSGPPDLCYPDEPAEIDYEISDLNGNPIYVEVSDFDHEDIIATVERHLGA